MKRAVVLASLLVALAGCSKKKSEPSPVPPAPPAAAEDAPVQRASATPPAPDPEPPELPTESDFEQEASEKITGSNLERELDQLERELIGR
jgi:hypothetical protein